MRDARKWAKKHKPKPEADELAEYLAANYPTSDGGPGSYKDGTAHPGYISIGDRDIHEDDPDWPGDATACEITGLYYKHVPHGRPRRYERLARELLEKGQRKVKRRQRCGDDDDE